MVEAVIGLGSNIDADKHIAQALKALAKVAQVKATSEIMVTKPIGFTQQEDFSNSAVLLHTEDDYDSLKCKLKSIEDALGRDRSRPRFGPREIDLDIIVYDDDIRDDDYYTRDFLQKLVAQVWTKK
ncbi:MULTISPECIES: 2-amino-4-hydroxy-6-hydroxymethyldihydropteridine diphosphokinase [unclassified Carboxylicivirga]|uniref:2-amino-4-hydroxy-6- hydroxymethyldihydropteridine diphosphokinase n=1 Tax=Carboxylicivirga TaxID=1628153 RepID=UPI003D34A823